MTSTKQRCAKLKDEILTQLAEQIKALQLGQQSADVIGDGEYKVTAKNIHLQCLMDLLDHILLHGLVSVEYGYWPFVKVFTHSETIKIINSHPQVTNDLDKGRVWIFMAIKECVLESYMRMFLNEPKSVKKYYSKYAFMRDNERLGILQTLVSGLDFIGLALDQDTPYLGYGGVQLHTPKQTTLNSNLLPHGSNRLPVKNVTSPRTPSHSREGSASLSSSVSTSSTLTAPTSPVSTEDESVDTAIGSLSLSDTKEQGSREQSKGQESYELRGVHDSSKFTTGGHQGHRLSTDQEALACMDPKYTLLDVDAMPAYERPTEEYRPRIGSNLSEISMDEVDIVFSHEQRTNRRHMRRPYRRKRERARSTETSSKADSRLRLPGGQHGGVRSEGAHERASSFVSDQTGEDSDSICSAVSGDSLDQFCRDADFGSSYNLSTELVVQPTVLECHNDEITLPKESTENRGRDKVDEDEGETSSLSMLQSSTEYEGIILGLPKRQTLQDTPGNLCDSHVDANTVLVLSLEIFKHSDEQFQQMFHVTTGHHFGQLQSAYVMLTNYAVYLLRKVSFRAEASFHTDISISYATLRKVEVRRSFEIGLNCQTVTVSSRNQQFTICFGDEACTRAFITSLTSHVSRASPAPSLSNLVSNIAVQQETDISRWMAHHDKLQTANSNVLCYSLAHWCGLSGPDANIEVISFQSVMEGTLEYKHHQYLGMSLKWTTGYFILTDGTLWQYNKQNDKNAKVSIDLRGTRCGGCRQIKDAGKKFAFEIVSSDGTGSLMVLAAPSEHEACEWIFKICQSIAQSFDSDDDRGCTIMHCVPCCLIATKDELVVCLCQSSEPASYQLISCCSLQCVTRIFVDNQIRNYCIVKFQYSELHDTEAAWLLCFRTEYELGKFESTVAGAWRELFQVDLQFLVLGDVPARKDARERVRKIEQFYTKIS
ncbi:pleckstrin homology domain-containing family M member 2 isoform X2 [Nematostella vectensis]|uniref:pleckstrin homology domain-containing family M member 2 isoform X2 n=1 Tax=Nematostella vectensis TaxID=45351 RepID=UPI002076FDEE|nr:pleckstrin homology domain-containing family M member 2 isoform X2 [Nematostella vectensis]